MLILLVVELALISLWVVKLKIRNIEQELRRRSIRYEETD